MAESLTEYVWTTADVAEELGVSPSTVIRWADEGELPFVRGPGRGSRRRFRPVDVEDVARRMSSGGDAA